jgi:hypothetical protein
LLDFAEHNFRLGRADKDGVSERDRLEQVATQLGYTPQDLIGPVMPDIARHLWDYFLELHRGRTYGASGPNPLSYEGIQAWCNLSGVALYSYEVDVIKELDSMWVRIMNEGGND